MLCDKPIGFTGEFYTNPRSRNGRMEKRIRHLSYLCDHCKKELMVPEEPYCKNCHKPLHHFHEQKNRLCYDCKNHNIDIVINRSALIYNRFLREKIALYKYRGKESLSEIFSFLLTITYEIYFRDYHIDYIAYIPLHDQRFMERGFNQAEQLARKLYVHTGVKTINALKRIKYTEKQSKHNKAERIKAMKGSFIMNDRLEEEIREKNILLIDDIYTTGSTMDEAVNTLKKAGASQVYSLTLARSIGQKDVSIT